MYIYLYNGNSLSLSILLLLEMNIHSNLLYTKIFSFLSTCVLISSLYPISNLQGTHFIVEIDFEWLFRRHILLRAAFSLATLQSDDY